MSFTWMRRIDLYIGKPLLRLLGFFIKKSNSLYGDYKLPHYPKRVICTKFIGLGSVVLSLPLFKTLKEAGVQIAFWSFPGQAEIVKYSGFADVVWEIKPTYFGFIKTLWQTIRQARAFQADAFLDLEPTSNFTTLLSWFSGAQIRIGFIAAKPLREQIYTHLVSLTPEHHITENNLEMLHYLGIPLSMSNPLPPLPQNVYSVISPLPKNPGRKRIVINVNSSDLSWHRMWVEDHWVSLCNNLLQDPQVDLVFPGVKSELPRVQRIMKKISKQDRIYNFAGKSTLLQLLQLLRESDLVVSVDSGIMHLAAWAKTPLVSLFGPETPSLYAPRSPYFKVVWASLPCSPCLSVAADKITRCKDN
ncbi:glycosyltransferase family 9 protein, partial [Candidatus Nomurabacteria bacterium]|nr:glycosyltransferase family 9 protein [Candidatus Nomurabacteria bacterium]